MPVQPVEAPTLASTGEQLSKEDIVNRQTTRGLKRKPHVIPEDTVEVEGSRCKRSTK